MSDIKKVFMIEDEYRTKSHSRKNIFPFTFRYFNLAFHVLLENLLVFEKIYVFFTIMFINQNFVHSLLNWNNTEKHRFGVDIDQWSVRSFSFVENSNWSKNRIELCKI